MKQLFRYLAGIGGIALIAGFLTAGFAGSAYGASGPPWEPVGNPPEAGGLLFFNSAGQEITGGSLSAKPIAAYVEGTATLAAGDSTATLYAYTPVSGIPAGQWSGATLGPSTDYPNGSAPAPLNGATLPVWTGSSSDTSLSTYELEFPNRAASTSSYANLYVLRLITGAPGESQSTSYDSADIEVTSTAGTWQVVYPAPTLTSTTTTVSASPGSPQVAGTSETLSASVSPAAPGTVQFEANGVDVGSPVTVSSGSATDLTAWTPTTAGTATLSAVFTPAQFSAFSGSTGTAQFTVDPAPAANTSTTLSVSPTSGAADTSVVLTAGVTSGGSSLASGAGSVYFYDNGTSTTDTVNTDSSFLGSEAVGSSGAVPALTYSSFAEGAHNLVAEFEPANTAQYNSSVSAVELFTATAPLYTPAQQGVTVSIPAGTLTITTPYTAANPFNLGTAVLNPGGGYFSASAPFGSDALPAAGQTYQGITITDTGVGEQTWTASVTATNFSGPDSDAINAQNLSFTGVTPLYVSGNQYGAGTGQIPVDTSDVTSATWSAGVPTGTVYSATASGTDGLAGGPHAFADTPSAGGGSVYIYGNLNLVAPSSVTPGLYTATLTFTIA